MKEYVVGLMFNKTMEDLLLIEKKRPAKFVGRLNGLGGLMKEMENPHDAMSREFEEECGIETKPSDWICIGDIYNYEYKVYFFKMKSDDILDARTTTDEEVEIYSIKGTDIFNLDLVDALSWIIPIALDNNVQYFSVEIK